MKIQTAISKNVQQEPRFSFTNVINRNAHLCPYNISCSEQLFDGTFCILIGCQAALAINAMSSNACANTNTA